MMTLTAVRKGGVSVVPRTKLTVRGGLDRCPSLCWLKFGPLPAGREKKIINNPFEGQEVKQTHETPSAPVGSF